MKGIMKLDVKTSKVKMKSNFHPSYNFDFQASFELKF